MYPFLIRFLDACPLDTGMPSSTHLQEREREFLFLILPQI
jgi:hypothetical protein